MVGTLRGSGDTQILFAVIKFIEHFALIDSGDVKKVLLHMLAPKSYLVKLLQHLIYIFQDYEDSLTWEILVL